MALKFIALSGTTGVNENLYIYEYNDQMLIVDCGIGFPDSDMLGIDMVIPDFSYVIKNKDKLVGILISHGHEDHMGALPYLLRDVQAPIYSTKLVSAFIQDKLIDHGIKDFDLHVFNPDENAPVNIGQFQVSSFRVSHSVPDTVCFVINTPEGKLVHATEYKFDPNPVDGFKFDVDKLKSLVKDGALAIATDCLGSNKPGFTPSESEIQSKIDKIVAQAKHAVYFTTVSSNISRMQQAINVAQAHGRFIVFVGRTIDTKANIAHNLGYLHYDNKVVLSLKEAREKPAKSLMYIIAGSYGQPGSALFRVALNEHHQLHLQNADTVIFSSDPAPPGSKETVDYLVDRLYESEIDVHYYDLGENLHVSGHGNSEDIKKMLSLVNAKYLIPIGGTMRHMKAFERLAISMNASASENIFELKAGEIVKFNSGKAEIDGRIEVKEVLVDGLGVGDVGPVVLKDRKTLSEGGIVMAVVLVDSKTRSLLQTPEIISRGFVFERENRELLNKATSKLKKTLDKRGKLSSKAVRDVVKTQLEGYFSSKIGRRPMILPVVLEV